MNYKRLARLMSSILAGAVLCLAAMIAVRWEQAAPVGAAPLAVSRPHDPVVIHGSELPEFDGVPIAELALLANISGSWAPVPFQIDELTASGDYTTTEDGLLDSNDELVFMAYDVGDAVAEDEWVIDAEARLHPRYAITVTDALEPNDIAHAYLHRSSTLSRSVASYVAFDEQAQLVTAISYTMAFSPNVFIGISDLTINGHEADVLDRQKLRSEVSGLINDTLTEEGLVQYAGPQTLTLPIVGPVRAVSSGGTSWFAFYASRIDVLMELLLSEQTPPASSIDQTRVSFDWNDPSATNMAPATYFDSNTAAGAPADGTNDVISLTPALSWFQYSGGLGGVVFVMEVDAGEDLVSNYYKDDATLDSSDTGDQRSFADAGIVVDKSGDTLGDLVLTETTYILPPDTGNVGDLAEQWVDVPLAADLAVQHFLSADIFLPVVLRSG